MVALIGALAVVAIGYVFRIRAFHGWKARLEFAESYLTDFLSFVRSHGHDYPTYTSLVERMQRMQRELGGIGLIGYKPPFANYIHRDYPVVLNLVPEVRRQFQDDLLGTSQSLVIHIGMVEDTIRRYIGEARDHHLHSRRTLWNPVSALAEGVRKILGLPVWILEQVGLISSSRGERVLASRLFGVISGSVTLLGIVASIVGLAADWDVVEKFWNWLWLS
ncbi:MAG: hypothetical protein ABIT38_07075 [Gemmatimonadaceae bacterium]